MVFALAISTKCQTFTHLEFPNLDRHKTSNRCTKPANVQEKAKNMCKQVASVGTPARTQNRATSNATHILPPM
jgi:hypothetical protein